MINHKSVSLLKAIIVIFYAFSIYACTKSNTQKEITSEIEVKIVKECLAKLTANDPTMDYLVSRRFDLFEFNSFLREDKIMDRYKKGYDYDKEKKKILDSLAWDDLDFEKVQQSTNKNNEKKSNSAFLKLSTAMNSHFVVFFSGIHENLVFVNFITYCNKISSSDLASDSFDKKQKFAAVSSFIFTLKDGKVKEMILDSGITLDYQCPD